MSYIENRYTVESVVAELKKLLKEDIPAEFKDWARDGITYIDRNPEAEVQDFPNNIFNYVRDNPMPIRVRELVEGILLEGISEGNAVAANNLGALYYDGSIGEQSYKKAMEYYELGAEWGNDQALENLGYCYYYGRETEVDYEKAFACFSKGAFLGRATSLYKIGDMYKRGYYVKQDEEAAFRIYLRCVGMSVDDSEDTSSFDADVHVRYADCLLNGIGCNKDVLEALYWAQRAEFEFRKRILKCDTFAGSGLSWAMSLISKCRSELDNGNDTIQAC